MRGNRFFFLFLLTYTSLAQAAEPALIRTDLSAPTSDLKIVAKNVDDAAASAQAVGRHRDGIGAAGSQASAPAIKAETGFDPIKRRSEELVINFAGAITRANLDLTYFYPNEAEHGGVKYHERGGWRAYHGGALVDQGLFISDAKDGNYRLAITPKKPFDRLELFATPYVTAHGREIAAGKIITDSSDFLVKHIAYRPFDENRTETAEWRDGERFMQVHSSPRP